MATDDAALRSPHTVGRWPRTSLLGSLTDAGRQVLLHQGSLVQYTEASRVLMREGEGATFVYLLLDGVVKATGLTDTGRDTLLAVRMGGDLVGEFAAIDGGTR
jgi:CRP/FNR family cyclic AMP-dependent transcriptional regulator